MANRLRLGIIGLGGRWQRIEPALAGLNHEVRIKAVYDPLSIRAEEVARRWRCAAVAGVVELVERDDLDAILVLTGRLGMWPVHRAVLANKPVYSAVSPLADEEHADADRRKVPDDAVVHVALWPALDLLIRTVRQRVLPELGAAQLIQVVWRAGTRGGDPLASTLVLALFEACAELVDAELLAVTAVAPQNQQDIVNVLVEFKGGAAAQLMLCDSGVGDPACRLDIQAEHGAVSLSLPRRIRWQSNEGTSAYTAPSGMAEFASLEAFVSTLLQEKSPNNDLKRSFDSLDWMRATRRSRDEGKRAGLGEDDKALAAKG